MTATNQQQAEALQRATSQQSITNEQLVIEGFAERGIYDAQPRQNVFTYNAWKALGRQVQKGQHGVKLITWIQCRKKGADPDDPDGGYKRPKTVSVFHVSQTEAI